MNNWLNDLNELKLPQLKAGEHSSPDDGVCAMEMVAFIERLPHSDSPECTCPIIAAFVRIINDSFNDEYRQKLLIRLPKLVGTVSKKHEQKRAKFLVWKAIKVFAPITLRHAGLEEHALKLENFSGSLKEAADVAMYAADVAMYAADVAYVAAHFTSDAAHFTADAAHFTSNAAAKAAAYASKYAEKAAAYAAHATYAVKVANATECTENFNDLILQTLDELLEIGPQGKWSNYSKKRVKELVELVKVD